MDTTLLRFTQDLNGQLQQRQLFYKELTKHQFAEIQARFLPQQSMIYRTYETEVPNGDSEVTFYNLCYLRRQQTKYFAANFTLHIPPYEFFGDFHEHQVQDWLIKDKGRFLNQKKRIQCHEINSCRLPQPNRKR